MDLEDLKRILRKDKGKIIIVENGEPVMIIAPYVDDREIENGDKEEAEPFYQEEDVERGAGELTIDDLPL
ncbi:MAG: hypothetical protein O3C23_00605 [bacterium]|nr:hypothetical protein [bacterium]